MGGGWGNWTGGVRLGLLDEMALNETFGHKSVAFVHPVPPVLTQVVDQSIEWHYHPSSNVIMDKTVLRHAHGFKYLHLAPV